MCTTSTNCINNFVDAPKPRKRVSIIKTIIIKEKNILYDYRAINSPALAAVLAQKLYENADREILVGCCLDTKCSPLSLEIIAIGNINTCIVSPREVFKTAILSNAANLIIFHNHISGDCTPSTEDINVTMKLIESGRILNIPILDHIIVGDAGRYKSLREENLVHFNSSTNFYLN